MQTRRPALSAESADLAVRIHGYDAADQRWQTRTTSGAPFPCSGIASYPTDSPRVARRGEDVSGRQLQRDRLRDRQIARRRARVRRLDADGKTPTRTRTPASSLRASWSCAHPPTASASCALKPPQAERLALSTSRPTASRRPIEVRRRVAGIHTADLRYLAILLYGARRAVSRLTGNLALLRSTASRLLSRWGAEHTGTASVIWVGSHPYT